MSLLFNFFKPLALSMALKIVAFFGFILLSLSSLQSQTATVSGYIIDVETKERLLSASVYYVKNQVGTTSNVYGFYSITLPKNNDSILLKISYLGYQSKYIKLSFNKDQKIDFELYKNTASDTVIVSTTIKKTIESKSQMSSIQLSSAAIKSMPSILGEADVFRALQMLPGVQSGGEASTGLYVRGGGADQNLILLDGVPVYNATHLFGFFSVFNADAIKNVELIKGGFPARFGGRLSSVIDISLKEGNKQKFCAEGGIGLLSSRVTFEGPLQKNKSSFMISARRTYADLIINPIVNSASNGRDDPAYYFYDVSAKMNVFINPKNHIYISTYFGKDKFYNKEIRDSSNFEAGIYWGNSTAMMRWNHEFNKKIFGNLTVNYSNYNFNVFQKSNDKTVANASESLAHYLSQIEDYSIKYDIDYLPNPNHFVKIGGSTIWHSFKPSIIQQIQNNNQTILGENLKSLESDFYLEDDYQFSKKIKANIGLHCANYLFNNNNSLYFQPRISIRYLINNHSSFKISYATMNQFLHLLTNSGIGLPTDLWVPATSKVPAQFSQQIAIGWATTFKNNYEISVESYYKTMQNVVDYAEGASFINTTNDWQNRVEIGKGKSYGIEFFVQKTKGKITAMLGYTLSYSNRQFTNINNGNWFAYKYDRRHDIDFTIAHTWQRKKNKLIETSLNFVYGTGIATTIPKALYINPNNFEPVEVYSSRNDFRYPAYHRLDIGIKFIKNKKNNYQRIWVLSIYNVYNNLNTFYIQRQSEQLNNGNQKQSFFNVGLFPILPSISYQFKF
jgi:TonB-dependent Receptor Plug Domain/CarboxypepD_reg-like domain